MKINSLLLIIVWVLYITASFYSELIVLGLPLDVEAYGYLFVILLHSVAIHTLVLWSAITISIYFYNRNNKILAASVIILGIIIISLSFINPSNAPLAFVFWFPKNVLCSFKNTERCVWRKALAECRPDLCDNLNVADHIIKECKEKAKDCYAEKGGRKLF